MEAIRRAILECIENSRSSVTAAGLEKRVRHRVGTSRKAIRRVVRELVEEGEIAYTYFHGCSFVEKAFRRPVRIGRRMVLVPHELSFDSDGRDIVIRLVHGAAFGCGRHPSTRLALKGIEYLLDGSGWRADAPPASCLDIGTGSGVLALAALLAGVGQAVGLDTDPCSLFDARANARVNRVDNRLKISGDDSRLMRSTFDMVVANLRLPTLKAIYPVVNRCLKQRGAVVFSGFKEGEEGRELCSLYRRGGLKCAWQATEKGWQAVVLFRGEPSSKECPTFFAHR